MRRGCVRKMLRRVEEYETLGPGKYVLYSKSHFVGLEIWTDGTYIVRPTCHTHIGEVHAWCPGAISNYEAIFQLTNRTSHRHEQQETVVNYKGGAQHEGVIQVHMALSGCKLLQLAVAEDTFLAPFIQRWVSEVSRAPSFTIAVISEAGKEISDEKTWLDVGRPATVLVIMRPKTSSLTHALFSALRRKNAAQVQSILSEGQDPNCTMAESESALVFAVRKSIISRHSPKNILGLRRRNLFNNCGRNN